jgi:hypothetical protein
VVWVGRGRVSRQFGVKDNDVRIGDFVMPRRASAFVDGANGEPDLEVRFEVRDGRPQCVAVLATAKPDGRQLRSSDLHVLALDAMTLSVFARLALESTYDPETNVTTMTPITDEREFWRAVNDVHTAVKAPHRGVTRAELEQVATVYRDNVDAKPVQQITTIMGYGSERTAARRVQQARDAGLLPPTTPGKRKA